MNKLIGVICLAAGVSLLFWGHNISRSINSEMKNLFTGTPTDNVMYYYIGGAVLCAVGAFFLLLKKKQ